MAEADYRFITDATGQRIAAALEALSLDVLTPSDVINSLTDTSTDRPLSAAQGKALNDKLTALVEKQTISVSGFNGNMKETELTITLKSGYTPYILRVEPPQFDTTHYIHYTSNVNAMTGKFYIEHNLTSTVTGLSVFILWIPN